MREITKEELLNIYHHDYIYLGKGLRPIAKELGIGENRLRDMFQQACLRIKNPSERTGIRKSSEFTKEEILEIYNYYYIRFQKGLRPISKELGIGENRLRILFQEAGLKIKSSYEVVELLKKQINQDVFSTWSKEMAYWLGFIAADGNVSKQTNKITIELKLDDKEHLEKFLNFLATKKYKVAEYDKKYQRGTKKICHVSFKNKKIKSDLVKLGILPNKSYKDIDFLEFVPKQYQLFFIIGYFDGDGSVCKVKKHQHFVVSFAGNISLIQSIKDYFLENHGFNDVKIQKDKRNNVHTVNWSSKKDLNCFRELYTNILPKEILLKRKLQIFKSVDYDSYVRKNEQKYAQTKEKSEKQIIKRVIKKCSKCEKRLNVSKKTETGLCQSCYKITTRVTERPSKDELLKLITTKSFLQIGKDFGVSDNAIRKWCKFYGLPKTKKEIKQLIQQEKIQTKKG